MATPARSFPRSSKLARKSVCTARPRAIDRPNDRGHHGDTGQTLATHSFSPVQAGPDVGRWSHCRTNRDTAHAELRATSELTLSNCRVGNGQIDRLDCLRMHCALVAGA